MKGVNFLLGMLFSPGQLTAIILVSFLLAGLIALNVVLWFLFHKRGARKLQTKQLQQKRDDLMQRLESLKSGAYVPPALDKFFVAVAAKQAEEEEEEPEEESEADDDTEETESSDMAEDVAGIEEEITDTGSIVRYNRSFTARVTQADGDLKARYSELKNYMLSFANVRDRMSWKREVFRLGRTSVASFIVRGKTLCLCLALDPKLFDGTKFKVDDLSVRRKDSKMPCMYRLKSDRKVGYAKVLIDFVMAEYGTTKREDYKPADYVLPYKTTEALVQRKLIKIIGETMPDFNDEDAAAAAKGIRYNRSFEARIVQADDVLKSRYSELKNHLLSYGGVADRMTWKRETFRAGRRTVATFMIRGRTLCLCLAAEPARFEGTKYKVEDFSQRSRNAGTPLLYRVKSDRRVTYAKQLIDAVFADLQLEKVEREPQNYAVPYKSTAALARKGLVRVLKTSPNKRIRKQGPDGQMISVPAEVSIPASELSVPADELSEPAHEAAATTEIPIRDDPAPQPQEPAEKAETASEEKAEEKQPEEEKAEEKPAEQKPAPTKKSKKSE